MKNASAYNPPPRFLLVFKKTFIWIVGFCILCGVLALFGADTIKINNVYYHGIQGFLLSLILSLPASALAAFPIWLTMSFFYWIIRISTSFFRSKSAEQDAAANP